MKLFLFLLVGLVGVEGILEIYDSLINAEASKRSKTSPTGPGVSNEGNKLMAAVRRLGQYQTAIHSTRQPSINDQEMITYTRCSSRPEEGDISNAILIGDQSSDGALANFHGTGLMKALCRGGPSYMKLANNEWYRIDQVTCTHPYSHIRVDGVDLGRPNDPKIAIMKLDRTRELSAMSWKERSQLQPTVYNGCDELH